MSQLVKKRKLSKSTEGVEEEFTLSRVADQISQLFSRITTLESNKTGNHTEEDSEECVTNENDKSPLELKLGFPMVTWQVVLARHWLIRTAGAGETAALQSPDIRFQGLYFSLEDANNKIHLLLDSATENGGYYPADCIDDTYPLRMGKCTCSKYKDESIVNDCSQADGQFHFQWAVENETKLENEPACFRRSLVFVCYVVKVTIHGPGHKTEGGEEVRWDCKDRMGNEAIVEAWGDTGG